VSRRQIANGAQLFEAASQMAAAACGTFDEQHDFLSLQSVRRFGNALREIDDAVFDRLILVAAGMCDQVLGADQFGALQFTTEGRDRFRANVGIDRSEVDQVVVMNDERPEIELVAHAIKEGAIKRGRRRSAPHTRARGEDLEGVRAEFVGFERGLFQRALAGSVDSDAQNSIVTATPAGLRYGGHAFVSMACGLFLYRI
jgi:hypothetical protein